MAECQSRFHASDGPWLHCTRGEHADDKHSFSHEWTTSQQYVPPPPPPTIAEQMERLRSKFPDAQRIEREYGFTVKFTLSLPKGRYNRDSAWVAFDVPPGFPAAHPSNFYTERDLRYKFGGCLNRSDYYVHPKLGDCMIVFGNVQAWNPNHCTLFTYAMVMKHAIEKGMFWREEKWDEDYSS